MTKLGMTSLQDTPSEDIVAAHVWTLDKEERKKIILGISEGIITSFTDLSYNGPRRVSTAKDVVHEHSVQLLSMGMFYLYFRDAIKEGDGERVLRCWWYMLPMFFSAGRKNYAKEALLFLSQQALLPGRVANQMVWSRFVNITGVPGGNIPADLHNEHLNRLCKEAVKALGSNKNEKGIIRAGKALGTLSPILRQFDQDNNVPLTSGKHSIATAEKDRDTIVNDLMKYQVLETFEGRSLMGIPKPKSLLCKGSCEDMYSWIASKIEQHFSV